MQKKKNKTLGKVVPLALMVAIVGTGVYGSFTVPNGVSAFFNQKESFAINTKAGTLDLTLTDNTENHNLDPDNDGIINPGDYKPIKLNVANTGEKSMNVRVVLTLKSAAPITPYSIVDSVKLSDNSADAKYPAVESTTALKDATGKNYTLVSETKVDDHTMQYVIDLGVLNGSVETEDSVTKKADDYEFNFYFDRLAKNAYIGDDVTLDATVYGIQHRNMQEADWKSVITTTGGSTSGGTTEGGGTVTPAVKKPVRKVISLAKKQVTQTVEGDTTGDKVYNFQIVNEAAIPSNTEPERFRELVMYFDDESGDMYTGAVSASVGGKEVGSTTKLNRKGRFTVVAPVNKASDISVSAEEAGKTLTLHKMFVKYALPAPKYESSQSVTYDYDDIKNMYGLEEAEDGTAAGTVPSDKVSFWVSSTSDSQPSPVTISLSKGETVLDTQNVSWEYNDDMEEWAANVTFNQPIDNTVSVTMTAERDASSADADSIIEVGANKDTTEGGGGTDEPVAQTAELDGSSLQYYLRNADPATITAVTYSADEAPADSEDVGSNGNTLKAKVVGTDLVLYTTADTINVSYPYGVFSGCTNLNDINALSKWKIKDGNPDQMFRDCENLTDISALSNWDMSGVSNLSMMFYGCRNLTDISALANWDVSNVSDMSYLLCGDKMTDLTPITNWNTSNVTDMSHMFQSKYITNDSLEAIKNWNTSKVMYMDSMFSGCQQLTSINALSGWKTPSLQTMSDMFWNCTALTDLSGLSGWDVSKVTDMSEMFIMCSSLTNVNGLSNWKTNSIKNLSFMFKECTKLSDISGLSNWTLSTATNLNGMFLKCPISDATVLNSWDVSNCSGNVLDTFKDTNITDGYYPSWYDTSTGNIKA